MSCPRRVRVRYVEACGPEARRPRRIDVGVVADGALDREGTKPHFRVECGFCGFFALLMSIL